MFLVTVIPITRTKQLDELTYFTATQVACGDVITVPLRSKSVPALVISIRDVAGQKIELKNSRFAIKRIRSKKSHKLISSAFVDAAQHIAQYYCVPLGSLLTTLLPQAILSDYENSIASPKPDSISNISDTLILQTGFEERWSQYKSIIRETFAQKRSVYFCVPTVHETRKARALLERGISEYTYILDSSMTPKQIRATWNAIGSETHPVLVIGTPLFVGVPRADIQTIILERESAGAYKSMSWPTIDMRMFIEEYGRKCGARLILGDTLLRTETIWRYNEGLLHAHIDPKFRLLVPGTTTLVDMKKDHKKEEGFVVIGNELREQIKETCKSKKHLFIFNVRRGLSPIVVCGDCSTTVACKECAAPVTLHKVKDKNMFVCHRCGTIRDAREMCHNCDSWKLNTLGIGIELAEEIIREEFPDVPLFRLDADSAKTPKQSRDVAASFYDTKGSILLGTEKALPYLHEPIEHSAVLSLDTLFAIPDFRINEKIAQILLHIRSHTKESFVLQTRQPEQKVLKEVLFGNLLEFYREEIQARKEFHYPPFSVVITITITDKREVLQESAEKLSGLLAPWDPHTFPISKNSKGKPTITLFLRIPYTNWPQPDIQKILRGLPPHYHVTIDPDRMVN